MTKLLSVLVFTFVFSACAVTPRVTAHKSGIDPEFVPYIDQYQDIVGYQYYKRFEMLSMNVVELDSGTLGRCYWLLGGGYEIEINKQWWTSPLIDFVDRQFVVFHELEHCIRHRMHSNRKHQIETIVDFLEEVGYYLGILEKRGYLPDGCPSSIMHSHVMGYWCQEKHYKYYIKEMRNWKR
jgi:hypothetical protein